MKKIDSEKSVERKLALHVKREKGLCIKLLCTHLTGLPDRLCLFPGGRLAFVELKTTGKKLRRSQLAVHRKLESLGYGVYVIDTLAGVDDFIRKFSEKDADGKELT